jgi:hypothetical protein
MQRCRDHWQNSDLGFDETDFTRIRHYARDSRPKSFGMLVHFSRNGIGRDSSRVALQADNVNNPSNLNPSRHAAGVMTHESMSGSQTTRPGESRSSRKGRYWRIDNAVRADAQGSIAINVPIFPALTGVDQISYHFPGQCTRDMHGTLCAERHRQYGGNERIKLLGR